MVCVCVYFATVASTEMWGRDDFSEKADEETTSLLKIKHAETYEDDKGIRNTDK